MLLLLLCTLSVGLTAATDIVPQECSRGPSLWCSSVKSAKTCGAVSFCARNTWSQTMFTRDINQDDTCDFCKKLVNDVKSFITSDEAEQEIVAFADNACQKLGQKFLVDECKGIVNLYVVQIISMLRQNLDATQACHALSLCVSGEMFLSSEKANLAVSNSMLTELAKQKLARGGVKESFMRMAPTVGLDVDQCSTCKQGVEDLKIVFANANVRQEVSQILKTNICTRFVLPSECNKLVDDYAPEIYQVIVNLDPEAACDTIGLCTLFALQQPHQLQQTQSDQVQASTTCVLCEYAVSTIFHALENNKTEAKIIETVTNLCNLMPSSVKSECKQFVDEYGQELIDLVTHSADPATICASLGLCGTQARSVNVKHFRGFDAVLNRFAENRYETEELFSRYGTSNKCMMCRIVANYLIALLNENSTAEVIEQGLERLCSVLPSRVSPECVFFVKQYTTKLMQMVMSELNTQLICQDIDLCPTAESWEQQSPLPQANSKLQQEQLEVAPFVY